MKIYYHADDYGINYQQSKSILDCYYHGNLNSVSIVLNSPDTVRSYELIRKMVSDGSIRCVAHLNFVEGKSVAGNLPHLTDAEGLFNRSFASVLRYGNSEAAAVVKKEFKKEISAQLGVYSQLIGNNRIYVDSHQHYHMIPLVWDALMEVIEEDGYELQSVRIPVDPLKPVWMERMLFKVRAINYIKWILLCKLSRYCIKHNTAIDPAPIFFGIPFTCRMDEKTVGKLIHRYIDEAEKEGKNLELMFHPGAIRNTDDLLDKDNAELVEFYSSAYRDIEKNTLLQKT